LHGFRGNTYSSTAWKPARLLAAGLFCSACGTSDIRTSISALYSNKELSAETPHINIAILAYFLFATAFFVIAIMVSS
jgi:hypothetical protein